MVEPHSPLLRSAWRGWLCGSWRSAWLICRRLGRHVGSAEARQHFVAHGELVDSRGDQDRIFLHVIFNDALVGIEIGVPRVGEIFDRVLSQTNARKSCFRERT